LLLDWNALVAAPLNKYLDFGKEEAMIGCRPTHPSVQMSLQRIADDGSLVTVKQGFTFQAIEIFLS
jgi:hypothetical protein